MSSQKKTIYLLLTAVFLLSPVRLFAQLHYNNEVVKNAKSANFQINRYDYSGSKRFKENYIRLLANNRHSMERHIIGIKDRFLSHAFWCNIGFGIGNHGIGYRIDINSGLWEPIVFQLSLVHYEVPWQPDWNEHLTNFGLLIGGRLRREYGMAALLVGVGEVRRSRKGQSFYDYGMIGYEDDRFKTIGLIANA